MDDDVDIGRHLKTLVRSWKLIAVSVVIAGALAFAWAIVQPEEFEATALVLVMPARFELQFEDRIQTQPGVSELFDLLPSYTTLATSTIVLDQLSEAEALAAWPEPQRSAAKLSSVLGAERSVGSANIIELTAIHEDPGRAAELANAWAMAFVTFANDIYGQGTSSAGLFLEQLAIAFDEYQAAQDELIEFRANNSMAELSRDINLREGVLQARLFGNDGQGARERLLRREFNELARTEAWLTNAKSLRDQIVLEQGSGTANIGNALALTLLRAKVFAGVDTGQIQLQISSENLSAISVADVDALIAVLNQRHEAAETRIATITSGLDSGEESLDGLDESASRLIASYTEDVRSLGQDLEAQQAIQRELAHARDLAWQTYTSLAQKVDESGIAAAGADATVRVASPSVPPTIPAGRPATTLALLGGVVGILIGSVCRAGARLAPSENTKVRVGD